MPPTKDEPFAFDPDATGSTLKRKPVDPPSCTRVAWYVDRPPEEQFQAAC